MMITPEVRIVRPHGIGKAPERTYDGWMLTLAQIMKRLRAAARPDQLEGMARYGINPRNRLGVSMPELGALAKAVGKDHRLALQLWDSGIPDARILASIVDEPEEVTEAQMEARGRGTGSWGGVGAGC